MAEQQKKKGGIFQSVKEFVYGVAAHDSARFAMKSRASMEHLFILITMGDLLGSPFCRPIILCGFCPMWCRRFPPGSGACSGKRT